MRWKNLASWLKGGIIGVSLYGIITLFTFLINQVSSADIIIILGNVFILLSIPGILISFLFFGRYDAMYYTSTPKLLVIIISSLFVYFLVGAIIGLIAGKIKRGKI